MKEAIHIGHLPGRTIQVEGTEYLYCSGTSYLGMARNQEFSLWLLEGMALYGTNYSSSRISNLQLQVYEEAEAYLAGFTGAEAVVTLSSGFLTGQMVIRLMEGTGQYFYAPRTHAALWRTMHDFFDADYETWVNKLIDATEQIPDSNIIIVSNSLDPLQAKRYSFNWLSRLPANKHITLIVDDSHGFGITGQKGSGIFRELAAFPSVQLIVISSFGKAFGIPGGVVLSDKKTIEAFKKHPFFGGSSPVIPAYLYAFLRSGNIYQSQRQKLFNNISQFESQIADSNLFDYFTNYPVFYTRENSLCAFLKQKNILISSFPYPTPESDLITRIIISSLHTPEDINRMAESVLEFSKSRE